MSAVVALLGPTNTGKTHHALERLLQHETGMIGFPLRLLARENYDRLVALRGAAAVALVTGEERIVPAQVRYFVCTVEAMPLERRVDFLAIDEVQLAADRERGHIFTERLLHARGRAETLLLGADTVRPLLRRLLPAAGFVARPRLSTLRYATPRKLARLPRRSAVVAFSIGEVYALAERLRAEAGGAAVVFGALSPRTRNAQVALYQAGDVDYLVATDAIGMGLNLDIEHVAFTNLVKFDGRGPRTLTAAEVAQVAGRAGRHTRDGSFGATHELGALDAQLVSAIEQHRFAPLERFFWRSVELDFFSPTALLRSLEEPSPGPELVRMRDADDQRALAALLREPLVANLRRRSEVELLWEVCRVPDFRNVMSDAHPRLLLQLFTHLREHGRLPEDWVAGQVASLDRTDGDTDTLLMRIAHIRTWTYVSQRDGWLLDAHHWRARTRAVEERLSDALHERLTAQFVDKRTAVVARQDRDGLLLTLGEAGELSVQGLPVGRLEGFRFTPEPGLRQEARGLLAAANRLLRAELPARVTACVEAPDSAFTLGPGGHVLWRSAEIARLQPGEEALLPRLEPLPSELLDPPQRERLRRRLAAWLDAHLRARLAPLYRLRDAPLAGVARGLVFELCEALGTVPRRQVAALAAALGPAERRDLARLGASVGRFVVYVPGLQAPALTPLKLLLHGLRHGAPTGMLPDGRPSVPRDPRLPADVLAVCGYLAAGPRALRVERVERLAAELRRAEREARIVPDTTLAQIAACSLAELPAVRAALGLLPRARDTRPRPAASNPGGA
jgi:ATP-dependent RNA helicase SUPV3L1/SUV3